MEKHGNRRNGKYVSAHRYEALRWPGPHIGWPGPLRLQYVSFTEDSQVGNATGNDIVFAFAAKMVI